MCTSRRESRARPTTAQWRARSSEIGGPEKFRLDELARRALTAFHDPREVISDPHARYYGIQVSERTLVPDNDARLGETRFEDWLIHTAKPGAKAGGKPA